MKNNFGQAMFEMFGVGKGEEGEELNENMETTNETYYAEPAETPAPEFDTTPTFSMPVMAQETPTYQKSFLAAGTVFKGNLVTKGDVEVAGDFTGDICSDGKITIVNSIEGNLTATDVCVISCEVKGDINVAEEVQVDANSTVIGNIKAKNALVAGKVAGDLQIEENIVLTENAHVVGNIYMATMEVSRGAKITGSIEMKN